ncbi:MAG: hypothetical protein ABSD31_17695 [Candidatus Binataceae bacterium]
MPSFQAPPPAGPVASAWLITTGVCVATPFAIVTPEIVSVCPAVTSRTSFEPPPLIVKFAAPGPCTVNVVTLGLLKTIGPLVSVIVPGVTPLWNVTVPLQLFIA